ncbi:MAG: 50S ribosomal protein L32 [Candidatus Levyibacteriota bacterium]
MPQEPKKRHSRQRQGKRRASIKHSVPMLVLCLNCSASILPHSTCKKCGYYKGVSVVNLKKTTKKEATK